MQALIPVIYCGQVDACLVDNVEILLDIRKEQLRKEKKKENLNVVHSSTLNSSNGRGANAVCL